MKPVKELVPGDLIDTLGGGGEPWQVTVSEPSIRRKSMWRIVMVRGERTWDEDYHPDEDAPVVGHREGTP